MEGAAASRRSAGQTQRCQVSAPAATRVDGVCSQKFLPRDWNPPFPSPSSSFHPGETKHRVPLHKQEGASGSQTAAEVAAAEHRGFKTEARCRAGWGSCSFHRDLRASRSPDSPARLQTERSAGARKGSVCASCPARSLCASSLRLVLAIPSECGVCVAQNAGLGAMGGELCPVLS